MTIDAAAGDLFAAYGEYSRGLDGSDVPYPREDVVLRKGAPWALYVDLERTTSRFDADCITGVVLCGGVSVIEVSVDGAPSAAESVAGWDARFGYND